MCAADLVMALIEAAYDKDSNVQHVIGSSLVGLGQKHSALVLSSCNSYLFKQPKVCLTFICEPPSYILETVLDRHLVTMGD